jgi:hypothetical protein
MIEDLQKAFEEERARFAAWIRNDLIERAVALQNPPSIEDIYHSADEQENEVINSSYHQYLNLPESTPQAMCFVAVKDIWKKAMILHIAETEGLDAAMLWKLQQE